MTTKTDVSDTAVATSRASPTTHSITQIPPLFPDDVFLNENLSAVGSRRPSLQVLNIASSSIPRVIGRGGSNVNTIREATGAHVEVEKQCLRKEQTTRKITIKGSPEAVKNAIMMIDLLMKDHNMLVTDIVDRVISKITQAGTKIIGATATATIATNNSPGYTKTLKATVPLNASVAQKTPPTNIWQKRAEAIREKKNPQLNLTIGEKPFINYSHDVAHSTFGSTSVICNNELKSLVGKQQGSDDTGELAALTKEEHQRKAPGYARPQSSMISMNYLHNNYNEKLTNPPVAPSLFDTIAARWTTNALDVVEESDSVVTGAIQNSWSYLLEERKNASPQLISNIAGVSIPPNISNITSEKSNRTESLWNVNNGGTPSRKQQYLPGIPNANSLDNGSTNSSSLSTPAKPFMDLQTLNTIDSNKSQALYTQTMLYQQKLQAHQFHQQQRIQRHSNLQPAQFGALPATALMLPQNRPSDIIHQPTMNRYPSPSLPSHRQPPPGFSNGISTHGGPTYLYCQQYNQQQNTMLTSNTFTQQTPFTAATSSNKIHLLHSPETLFP
uniref:K Homology domain-containing protein n=1 Tax=Meloidogyne enterolobii TaxID=390850 RepID=A0A6V7UNG7_MELEN|nr:unnamed protein product [Meloidogyne enterolobii]